MLTLSPVMVAPVCLGDPLQLTCTTSVEFIKWRILQPNDQDTLLEVANAQINSRDTNQISHRVVNSATFTFMRSSAQGASPLISTLSIDSVNIGLNGTVVNCSDVPNLIKSASTTIHVIDANTTLSKLYKLMLIFLLSLCTIIVIYRSVYSVCRHYVRRI